MCSLKRLTTLTILTLLLAGDLVHGKKTRKFKRTKNEENDETTPQPNVVTYSTFGFNDVGPTYDGFVPSSPDYASYLSGNTNNNQETTTRLYGPAFPTAMDNTAYAYGQPPQEVQSYGSSAGGDNEVQTSMLQYDPSSYNFGTPQGFGQSTGEGQNNPEEGGFDQNEDYNAPVYGTKLSNGNQRPNKMKQPYGHYNSSNMYGTSDYNSGDVKYTNYHEQQPQESKPAYGESANNAYKPYNYPPTYPPTNNEEIITKPPPSHAVSSVKFHKVVDFTKFKPTYPTEVDNKYALESMKPMAAAQTMSNNNQNENSYMSSYHNSNNDMNPSKYHENNYEDEEPERVVSQPMKTNHLEFSINHVDNSNSYKSQKPAEFKDKFKNRPWNYSSDFSNWKNTLKNYDYFNDNKTSGYKRPYKGYTDEVTSSSNNVVDLTNYKFPESSYSSFKKIPDFKQQASENYPSIQSFKYPDNPEQSDSDFFNQLKGLYSTVPSTTTHWGSGFKGTETPSYKSRHKKPLQLNDDDIVHIPKRHNKYHIKQNGHKQSEWSSGNRYKGKPIEEWNKEVPTRFKSEEDLLGLRNHDTSHPSYLPQPAFKLTNEVGDEYQKYFSDSDYKKLVDKWRQSYMKSKFFKDSMSAYRDNEAYGTDSRPMHVPVPKPYPVEVPHPVIVPVPQPYPVRVPVPKPVAVPVIRELSVPIEKPVPYPVYKKVPYPVEKLVPYPVEKEVQIPVHKPYAVPVPHVRPVFHHSRPSLDELDSDRETERDRDRELEEDDYMPRPAASSLRGQKYVKYYKKTRSNRNRSRRPAPSSAYYERNRRRWPTSRPSAQRSSSSRARRPRTTSPPRYAPTYKYQEDEEDYDHDHSDYFDYCRKNGNC